MFGEWRRKLWYLMHRDQAARDLEEEIRIHIELRAQSIAADSSAPRDEHAYARARRAFGNTTTILERSRDMWGLMNVDELVRDIRFAVRRLVQRRAFALSVITVMAIGIGATTAMFSAVDAALLRPLPFQSPEQLVSVRGVDVPFDAGGGGAPPSVRKLDVTDLQNMSGYFSSVAAYASGGLNLADDDRPVRLKAGVVTASFFSTLGVRPVTGRTFNDVEGKPGGPDVVVLSHGLWQRQFGGRDIAGLHITLGSKSFQVIGVMPARFSFPNESDVWIPFTIPSTFATFDAFRGFLPSTTIARITSGVTLPVASAQLLTRLEQTRATMEPQRLENYDAMLADVRANGALQTLQQQLVGKRTTALFVLLGATGLLLLIACVNVTNLLLSQASARRRELAVRQVLGATRGRLIRQLLAESLVLSIAGASVGVVIAPLALNVMRSLLPTSLSGVAPATIDLRVLVFATCVALLSGIAFGLWPAFRSTRESDSEVIKSGSGHGSTASGTGRVRRALVSAELSLTVMLLIGAGLMLRSFDTLMSQDNGMRIDNVGTLELSMLRDGSGAQGERVRKINDIVARVASMPGVTSAGVVNDLPLNPVGGIGIQISIDGSPVQEGDKRGARYLFATEGYFPTMGIKLLRGRNFTLRDNSAAPKVVIISNSMAKDYWPNVDPIGHTVDMGGKPMTVIGVVADVRERKLEESGGPQMYLSMHDAPPSTVALVARGDIPARAMLAHLLDAVRSVDKSQAVYNVRMMDDVMSASVAPRRTNTLLIGAFALLALVLASVGVYAVVSYGVSHRARELGIRSALGATGRDLMAMIAREMVGVTALGIVIGIAGAWALAKTLESLVYGVDVHDGLTFAVVPFALLVPTLLATFVPARRTLRVNPAEVMRAD